MLKTILTLAAAAYVGGRFVPSNSYISSGVSSVVIFAELIFCYVIYCVYIFPFWISPTRNIPLPEGHTFWLGHGKKEIGAATGVIHYAWSKTVKNPNPHFYRYLGFGGAEKIILTSPEAARQVMNDLSFEIPDWFRLGSTPLLGDGLINSEGLAHKILRKQVAPAFSATQVRSFVPEFWPYCLKMNQKMEESIASGGGEWGQVDISDFTHRVTFDMIGKTAYGAEFNGLEDPEKGFYAIFNRHYPIDGFTDPVEAFSIYVLPIFVNHAILDRLPIPAFQSEQATRKEMLAEYTRLIRAVDISKFKTESKDAVQKNMIATMLKDGQMDLQTMLENMMTFTGAGYGTNASSVLWAVYILGTRPEIQTRLREEIRRVLGSSAVIPDSILMDQMEYLRWFVLENSRLFPSLPGAWREAKKDAVVCDQLFPKGTQIVVASFATNRSKAVWGPNAEEFEPERWSPERVHVGAQHDGSLMTYSVGHKQCVGKEYSIRAIKTVLIALVSNFEFAYQGGDLLADLVPGITLRPRGGLKCMVRKASPW